MPFGLDRKKVVWLAAIIVAANGFFPVVWIFLTSVQTEGGLMRVNAPGVAWFAGFDNYMRAFTQQPLWRFTLNSFIVAIGATIGTIIVSSGAAYAVTRLRVPHRNLILQMILVVSMFPLIALMVPLFEIMTTLGLRNTYLGLILPYIVLSMPVCTLVLASFFQDIPVDLENAAMIDGCTRVGALIKVVIPLTAPGVFTAAILSFVNAWDEFLLALTLNNQVAMRTLPVGITLYQGEFAFPWPIISAALIVAIVPVSILIALFQERVVSGLTAGGVKG